jgi:histidinol phosphatase-like PHP family hydrolase
MGYMELCDAAVAGVSDAEFLDAFGLAAANGVALEITASYLPDFWGGLSVETPLRYLSLAKKAGCRFTLGTDAHKPEVRERLPELARITEAMGLTQDDLLALALDGA